MGNNNAVQDEILKIITNSPAWLIISHEKPDGDTVGCAVALTRLGMRLSKNVMLICPDPCPVKYDFITGGLEFNVRKHLPEDFPGPGGVIICVDASTTARSYPELLDRASCPVINIDHHEDNESYGDVNWIDLTASATGEMIASLIASSSWDMTTDEAEALYVALITDNGGFSYASTTFNSHLRAMTLLEAGVSPDKIAEKLNSNLTEGVLQLWGRALVRATVFSEGDCAVYWLSRDDFAETGAAQDATENLVNLLLRIKGVKMAALCSELPDREGYVRVSLRARSPFNAREVAKIFGGGGHDLASGCVIQAPLTEAVSMLRREMNSHVSGISADR